jgi:hypothetical protein
MTVIAIIAGAVLYVAWCCIDHADDGVDVPLHRLAHRLGTAARIDPGVKIALSGSRGDD